MMCKRKNLNVAVNLSKNNMERKTLNPCSANVRRNHRCDGEQAFHRYWQ